MATEKPSKMWVFRHSRRHCRRTKGQRKNLTREILDISMKYVSLKNEDDRTKNVEVHTFFVKQLISLPRDRSMLSQKKAREDGVGALRCIGLIGRGYGVTLIAALRIAQFFRNGCLQAWTGFRGPVVGGAPKCAESYFFQDFEIILVKGAADQGAPVPLA